MSRKNKLSSVSGILRKTRNGDGFVVSPDHEDDIFIDAYDLKGAMDGDMVSVDLFPYDYWGNHPQGTVDRILNRSQQEVVGTFERAHGHGLVIPVSKKQKDTIVIPKKQCGNAKTGDKVIAKITKYPSRQNASPEGILTEIIAKQNSSGASVKALIRASGLSENFPSHCEAEASKCAGRPVSEAEIQSRTDLRDHLIVTIDGSDSKDLDDAVSIDKLPNGNYLLGVHIADVSYYVKPGTALDKEAAERGNSVYLINRVIPMLPKSLSNGICSLFEGADRLTLSCDMEIDRSGNIVNHKIYKSVIRSSARLVYDDVSDLLEYEDSDQLKKYDDYYGYNVAGALREMEVLARILHENRSKNGSIDFETEEPVFELDENEKPTDIHPADRRIANRMIEEFMLAANKTVAGHYRKKDLPFVYRIHEHPDAVKLEELKSFLSVFGIRLNMKNFEVEPSEISRILDQVKGEPHENIVTTILLRTMKKAEYSTECLGHYALAFKDYCHFTSPIRRYPDLMIHRIISEDLAGHQDRLTQKSWKKHVARCAEHSSQTEREAQELERDVDKMKMAEYMKDHRGEVYPGVISGVQEYGIYVQLENTCEGLVPISTMDDYFIYEPSRYRLIGEHTNTVYSLGDPITIRVSDARPEERQIDFVITKPRH